eukprot:NODE_393_length_8140_cov_0.738341.p1 type:complete len:870 gc:universal NODE_393_length_8140_cov_0.738341:6723-4114(-)
MCFGNPLYQSRVLTMAVIGTHILPIFRGQCSSHIGTAQIGTTLLYFIDFLLSWQTFQSQLKNTFNIDYNGDPSVSFSAILALLTSLSFLLTNTVDILKKFPLGISIVSFLDTSDSFLYGRGSMAIKFKAVRHEIMQHVLKSTPIHQSLVTQSKLIFSNDVSPQFSNHFSNLENPNESVITAIAFDHEFYQDLLKFITNATSIANMDPIVGWIMTQEVLTDYLVNQLKQVQNGRTMGWINKKMNPIKLCEILPENMIEFERTARSQRCILKKKFIPNVNLELIPEIFMWLAITVYMALGFLLIFLIVPIICLILWRSDLFSIVLEGFLHLNSTKVVNAPLITPLISPQISMMIASINSVEFQNQLSGNICLNSSELEELALYFSSKEDRFESFTRFSFFTFLFVYISNSYISASTQNQLNLIYNFNWREIITTVSLFLNWDVTFYFSTRRQAASVLKFVCLMSYSRQELQNVYFSANMTEAPLPLRSTRNLTAAGLTRWLYSDRKIISAVPGHFETYSRLRRLAQNNSSLNLNQLDVSKILIITTDEFSLYDDFRVIGKSNLFDNYAKLVNIEVIANYSDIEPIKLPHMESKLFFKDKLLICFSDSNLQLQMTQFDLLQIENFTIYECVDNIQFQRPPEIRILDSNCIDYSLKIIKSKIYTSKNINIKIHSNQFYTNLSESSTRSFSNLSLDTPLNSNSLNHSHLIMIPIQIDDFWSLAIYFPKSNTICYFDSTAYTLLPLNTQINDQIIHYPHHSLYRSIQLNLVNYFQFKTNSNPTFQIINSPKCFEKCDSGVFLLVTIRYILHYYQDIHDITQLHEYLNFTYKDMDYWRCFLYTEIILNHHLLTETNRVIENEQGDIELLPIGDANV